MPQNSKAVRERLWSLRGLKHNLVEHLPRVVDGAEAELGPGAGLHARGLLDIGLAGLDASGRRLGQADINNVIEGLDDAAPRTSRDEFKAKVREELMSLFLAVQAGWGMAVAQSLHLGAVPHQADEVLRMARTVLESWAKQTLPAPRLGLVIDVASTVEALRADTDGLAGALDSVSRELAEGQTALQAKNDALAEFDRKFIAVADLGTSLLALCGEHELAERLKPSPRRSGRTNAVADGLDEVPEVIDDVDAPAADAPAPTPVMDPEPV